ncbi:MAG: ABC transporter permease [Thermoguttaceae bacterium]
MNATIFGRILWKEYRTQRSFWISMAVLTLVIEVVLRVLPWDNEVEAGRIALMLIMAVVFAALYGLGSGATLFATEREVGTYDFLQALPAKPLVVFAGKVVFTLASTVAIFLVAWTLALTFAGRLPTPRFPWQTWQMWILFGGLAGAELIAWGILFSLLLKRTLVAAILAGIVMSILYLLSLVFVAGSNSGTMPGRTIPGRMFILAFVTVADVALASRWFRERWFSPAQTAEATGWALDRSPFARTMLGRLVWQELRQSAAMTAALFTMLLPTVLVLWTEWIFGIRPQSGGHWFEYSLAPLTAASFLIPSLLGASVFLADQMGCRFRFLAEHGIPPRLVWLSRQIHGLVLMLLGLLLVLPPVVGLNATRHAPDDMLSSQWLLGFVALGYACGQLCSMAFRSGIMAAAVGTILTYLLCLWAGTMYMFGLSWLWTVAPLPLAFIVITWLHAPDWLVERTTWRARLRPALVVAVPALAILAAIPLVRIYEIPLVKPGFDVQELTRPVSPEQRETLALYERAVKLLRQADRTEGTPAAANESERQKAKEQAMTLALEASRRPLPGFCLDPLAAPDPTDEISLAQMVLDSAKPLEAGGRLDAALDRYVAAAHIAMHARQRWPGLDGPTLCEIRICEQLMQWAAQSGQKPQRLLEALRTIDKLWRNPPTYCGYTQKNYLLNLRILNGDREALKELHKDTSAPFYSELTRWLPWERARAVRLLNKLTAEEFALYRSTELVLAIGGGVSPDMRASPVFPKDFTYKVVPQIKAAHIPLDDWLKVETYRRATRLILALEAWKLEHDGLPKSLDDLMGKYLNQLPVDPDNNSAFRYELNGLPHGIEWRSSNSAATQSLKPGQPFIACNSWPNDGSAAPQAPVSGGGLAASEVWEGVYVFPIP